MFEKATKNYLSTGPAPVGIVRWLPAMVVLSVVVGFVALAWYAYHAGTQSLKDADLLVVEADKTPIKEKPVDAGGMQFPNQDKTIFDTFAGNNKQPPKVERVLPTPEEPVASPAADTSQTAGWINDKLHKKTDDATPAQPEQVIAPANNAAQKEQDVIVAVKKPIAAGKTPVAELQVVDGAPQHSEQPESYIAKPAATHVVTPVPLPQAEPKTPVEKPEVTEAAPPAEDEAATSTETVPAPAKAEAPEKKVAAVEADKKSASGNIKVQLGAYRSEEEARDAWHVMQKKHAGLLGQTQPSIVKADLGAKGIYYRLRVGAFSSNADASVLCAKLVSAGQQCIIPTSK